jgi:hypothetical protein
MWQEHLRASARAPHNSHKIKQNKDLFACFCLAESLFEEVK